MPSSVHIAANVSDGDSVIPPASTADLASGALDGVAGVPSESPSSTSFAPPQTLQSSQECPCRHDEGKYLARNSWLGCSEPTA